MPREITVGKTTDVLEGGGRLIVEVFGREIGIFGLGDEYFALSNICPHQRGPVCRGWVSGRTIATRDTDWKTEWVQEGEILRCAWHFIEFDIKTGGCLPNPKWRVKTYEVKVTEDGELILVLDGPAVDEE